MKKLSRSSSIASRIHPVSDIETVMAALFYGRAGTGKTTLAGTFPAPILLDIKEKGTDSVSDRDLDVLRIDTWKDLEDVYFYIKSCGKYKSVIVDALHSMQDLALEEIKRLNKKSDSDPVSQRDFGQAAGLMRTWVYNYRDLISDGIHVVFLAHEKVVSGEGGDEEDGMISPEVGPRLMPSVASMVTGAVNILGHTFIAIKKEKGLRKPGEKQKTTTEYCLRIGPHGYYTTKIRKPKGSEVPEVIVNPDFEKLMEAVTGKAPVKPGLTKVRKVK